ncbi:MAG: transglutaminase family protein [Halioglobus sp.]
MIFRSMMLSSSFSVLMVTLLPQLAVSEERVFEFTYELHATDFPRGQAVDIYLPLASDQPGQRILNSEITASVSGQARQEYIYGNDYYLLHRAASSDEAVSATLRFTVARDTVTANPMPLSEQERARFIGPNSLVPVNHEILDPILGEIRSQRADDSPAATARAIYDWVVDNVEYKKIGTGWGNGDTFWACNERYGNCTDFHALFVSLARTEGIPARFEIGFPVPGDRAEGNIGGYHCWVRFYLPGRGWIPIDASEAAKHPEQRELLYGTQPADRIHFSTGRDLVLSEASDQRPLNYFIYPYIEVDGQPWSGSVETSFRFREIPADTYAGE